MDDIAAPIPITRMGELIGDGEAVALLRASASPVRYRGQWWAVPAQSPTDDYVPVTGPEALAVLDDAERRLSLASAR